MKKHEGKKEMKAEGLKHRGMSKGMGKGSKGFAMGPANQLKGISKSK